MHRSRRECREADRDVFGTVRARRAVPDALVPSDDDGLPGLNVHGPRCRLDAERALEDDGVLVEFRRLASKYVDGKYSYTVPNTAALDSGIGLSASASVTVDCTLKPLVPTKTAAGEWDRTVTWTLTKSVAPASHSGYAGDSFNSTWTIVADKTDSGPMNFVVKGQIKVDNPSTIDQNFSISDKLNDAAGTVATVTCPVTGDNTGTVKAGEFVTCDYVAYPKDATATKNTATISMTGNPDQTASADITWKENLTGYDSGKLEDTHLGISETISTDTTKNIDETFACSTDVTKYTNGKYSYEVPNTATLDSGIGPSAPAKVKVTCNTKALTASKTATASYDRTVTWTLTKSVAPDSHTGFGRRLGTPSVEVCPTASPSRPSKLGIRGPSTPGRAKLGLSQWRAAQPGVDGPGPSPPALPFPSDVPCTPRLKCS